MPGMMDYVDYAPCTFCPLQLTCKWDVSTSFLSMLSMLLHHNSHGSIVSNVVFTSSINM